MILSFHYGGLRRLYQRDDRRQIPPQGLEKIKRILARLDAATEPHHKDLPRFRLHPLRGPLRGFWAVTVPANWRIIFRFEGNTFYSVDLVDYH